MKTLVLLLVPFLVCVPCRAEPPGHAPETPREKITGAHEGQQGNAPDQAPLDPGSDSDAAPVSPEGRDPGGNAAAPLPASGPEKTSTRHDPIKITASIDNTRPTAGDWVTYRLSAEGPKGVSFVNAEPLGKLPYYVALRFPVTYPQESRGDRVSRTWEFTFDFLFSGPLPLPPFVLTYIGKDGKKKSLLAPSMVIDVKDMPLAAGESAEIRPDRPVRAVDVDYSRVYLAGACALLALLILAIGLPRFVRWLRTPVQVPPPPAHEIAYEQMRQLVEEQLIEQGQIELFYVRLSDICRHYIENRFGLKAPELTTDEFLEVMATVDFFSGEQKELLRDFMAHCDLVKFAQYAPTEDEMREAFYAARHFVDETRDDILHAATETNAARGDSQGLSNDADHAGPAEPATASQS